MKVPAQATPDVQQSFREVWEFLERLESRNLDLGGRRIINAGHPISPADYVRQFELEKLREKVNELEERVNGQSVS